MTKMDDLQHDLAEEKSAQNLLQQEVQEGNLKYHQSHQVFSKVFFKIGQPNHKQASNAPFSPRLGYGLGFSFVFFT